MIHLQTSLRSLIGPADIVTAVNAICGFLAILFLFLDQRQVSYSLIFLSLFVDGIDGRIARRFGTSRIGENLEAMADMTSLSLAPLAFVFYSYYPSVTTSLVVFYGLVFSCIILLAASIFRLASFHLLKEAEFFRGLPTSASAIFMIVLSLLHVQIEIMLFVLCFLAAALVSPVRFPKLGSITTIIAAVLIFPIFIFHVFDGTYAPILLLCVLLGYILVGPFLVVLKKKIP